MRDWFKIGKGVHQGYILSPCLFNLYAEYITWNARLDDSQDRVKTAGRNINNLRYADDHPNGRKRIGTKEPLDEGEKAGLKLNIQKTKIMASSPITSWQTDGEKWKQRFYFLGLQNHCRPGNWKMPAPWKKSDDKCRLHIKNQRHHFAVKLPSSQSYGFSSSHVQI